MNSPVLALFPDDGRHVADTIPKGAFVTIDSETFNGNKLIQVVWDGKTVMMFTQDLRSRGEKVEPPA
jgi:hypothetical protein